MGNLGGTQALLSGTDLRSVERAPPKKTAGDRRRLSLLWERLPFYALDSIGQPYWSRHPRSYILDRSYVRFTL